MKSSGYYYRMADACLQRGHWDALGRWLQMARKARRLETAHARRKAEVARLALLARLDCPGVVGSR